LDKIEKDLGIENINRFRVVPLKNANKFTWNFWTLQRYFRKKPADVYLTQYITPFFVPKKIKIATIIHDVSFNSYLKYIKKVDLLFLKFLIPLSLKRADKIIGVSKFTYYEVMECYGVSQEKMAWIHNAVADEYLSQNTDPERLKKIRAKYDLPEKFILYLGTLQPRKNLPTLVRAFSEIENKIGDMKLVLAGGKSHNYDRQIDRAVRQCDLEDKVICPGFIEEEDKAAVMKLATIFCFPSFYEGFGIPILEAFAVGTPVVASGILPHKEISGDAALFFDPNDSHELAEKIIAVINDNNLRESLIQKGLEQVKNFSWKKTAEKMLGIFENMK
jgi:glycosyltransferase involved in cell wall biosynthesis